MTTKYDDLYFNEMKSIYAVVPYTIRRQLIHS